MQGNPSRFGLQNLRLARRDRNPQPATCRRAESFSIRAGRPPQRRRMAEHHLPGIGNDEPLKDGGLHGGNLLAVKDLMPPSRRNASRSAAYTKPAGPRR